MKLYTENQIKQFLRAYTFIREDIIEDMISNSLTPIELPSDEEIDNKAFYVPFNGKEEFYDKSFITGAKWMKEQILNQDK